MVLKRFENLKGQDCLNAIAAIKLNSNILFDTADQAATKGNYGVARSLLILGSEEFIKGAILYLSSIEVQVFKINEVKKALNSHKERHEIAMFIKLFQLIDTWIKVEEYKPTRTSKLNWLNKTISFIDKAVIILDGLEGTGSDLDWWSSADNFKNGGFYVDYKDQLILPQEITDQDFAASKTKVRDLIKRFSLFQIALERTGSKVRKDLVKDLNEGVNLYVTTVNKRNIAKAKKKTLANSNKEIT